MVLIVRNQIATLNFPGSLCSLEFWRQNVTYPELPLAADDLLHDLRYISSCCPLRQRLTCLSGSAQACSTPCLSHLKDQVRICALFNLYSSLWDKFNRAITCYNEKVLLQTASDSLPLCSSNERFSHVVICLPKGSTFWPSVSKYVYNYTCSYYIQPIAWSSPNQLL